MDMRGATPYIVGMTDLSPREQMIRTALTLFKHNGYHATTWRNLVEEAGTPWGSAYHYFPGGKVQLGIEAVTMAGREVAAQIKHQFATAASPTAALHVFIEMFAVSLETSGYRAGCPVATVALETTPETPQMAEACAAAFALWEAAMAEGLQHFGRPPEEAKRLAVILLALYEGALVVSRVSRSTAPLMQCAAHMGALLSGPAYAVDEKLMQSCEK